jgi:hypothetical protein
MTIVVSDKVKNVYTNTFAMYLCNRKKNCLPPKTFQNFVPFTFTIISDKYLMLQRYRLTATLVVQPRCKVKKNVHKTFFLIICTQNFLLPTPLGLEEPTMQLAEEKQVSTVEWRLCVS